MLTLKRVKDEAVQIEFLFINKDHWDMSDHDIAFFKKIFRSIFMFFALCKYTFLDIAKNDQTCEKLKV